MPKSTKTTKTAAAKAAAPATPAIVKPEEQKKTTDGKQLPKAAATPKTAKVAKAEGKKAPKTSVLKTICAEVGIDPKTARRILRKRMRGDRPEIAKFHTIKTRWVQSDADAKVIRDVLQEYAKAA